MTLLSVVLALALTATLAACGSDEPSGVTTPDRTASTPTETPGSGDASTATVAAATAPPAASGSTKTDREALVALYNATGDENGTSSDNWLSDAPLGEWRGVTTNGDGRVTELDLTGSRFSGEIPPELGSLSNLQGLDLGGNQLSGCVPSSLEDQLRSSSNLGDLPFC